MKRHSKVQSESKIHTNSQRKMIDSELVCGRIGVCARMVLYKISSFFVQRDLGELRLIFFCFGTTAIRYFTASSTYSDRKQMNRLKSYNYTVHTE